MELFVLRHGEAGRRLAMGAKDSERGLTVTGKKEVELVAEAMSALGFKVDTVLTSPLKRSYETAEIVAKRLKLKEPVNCDELRPEGARVTFYRRLARLRPSSSVLVVGHEPYLSTMLSEMISRETDSRISLKKAGLAKVAVSGFAPRVTGELRWLLTPRQLRRMA